MPMSLKRSLLGGCFLLLLLGTVLNLNRIAHKGWSGHYVLQSELGISKTVHSGSKTPVQLLDDKVFLRSRPVDQAAQRTSSTDTATNTDEEVSLLVIVKSAPGAQYIERRKTVRSTWLKKCSSSVSGETRSVSQLYASTPLKASPAFVNGNVSIHVRCFFVVGQGTTKKVRDAVAEEIKTYGDVVEASLIDDYEKMTSKTQWILLWSLKLDYTYLALIDDDAVVVFSNLLPWLAVQPREKFYAGHQHLWLGVKRCDTPGQLRKNCVYPNQYPVRPGKDDYEPFASGFGYVMSRDAALGSAQAALGHLSYPGLPGNVEDAMVGVLLAEVGVRLKDAKPQFYHWAHDGGRCPRFQDGRKLLVLGNAPTHVLTKIAENERLRQPLCSGLP